MSHTYPEISLRQAAIIAGVSILVMTIAAFIAEGTTIGNLFVENNAETTTMNILASAMLFRFGVFSWLVILICDVLAAWGLYIFLRPVNKSLSLLTAWFRLIYVVILATALLYLFDVLLITKGADNYLAAWGTDLLQAQVLLSMNGFYQAWSIGLIIFGIHILGLGYLILRSTYVPNYWGVLLIIAGIGYLLTNCIDLLIPGYKDIKKILEWIFIIPMLAEVGLGFWLLLKKNIKPVSVGNEQIT